MIKTIIVKYNNEYGIRMYGLQVLTNSGTLVTCPHTDGFYELQTVDDLGMCYDMMIESENKILAKELKRRIDCISKYEVCKYYTVPIKSIIVPEQCRKISAERRSHIDLLATSIQQHGLINPLKVDRHLILFSGFMRLEALTMLHRTEVAVQILGA